MPEVSVVITTYNRADYLSEAVESVLNQTYQDFELIIVDDGSTDNTNEVVSRFHTPKIKYIYQLNRGAGSARNQGIQSSSGDEIALLDADDLWLPLKLEKQIEVLKSQPEASVIYSDMYLFGKSDSAFPKRFFELLQWPPPRGNVLEKMLSRSFGHPSTLLIKREVFDQIGLFDESIPYCDDYDMLIRMAAYYFFEVIPIPLVKYRLHSGQISKNIERILADHIRVFHKALQLPVIDSSSNIRQITNNRLARYHFEYGIELLKHGNSGNGINEIFASLKTNPKEFIPASFALFKRFSLFVYRKSPLRLSFQH